MPISSSAQPQSVIGGGGSGTGMSEEQQVTVPSGHFFPIDSLRTRCSLNHHHHVRGSGEAGRWDDGCRIEYLASDIMYRK